MNNENLQCLPSDMEWGQTPVQRSRERYSLEIVSSELVVVDVELSTSTNNWHRPGPPPTIHDPHFMSIPAPVPRGASLFPSYCHDLNTMGAGSGSSVRHGLNRLLDQHILEALDPSTTDGPHLPCNHNETPRTPRVQHRDRGGLLHAHLFHPIGLQSSPTLLVYLPRCPR